MKLLIYVITFVGMSLVPAYAEYSAPNYNYQGARYSTPYYSGNSGNRFDYMSGYPGYSRGRFDYRGDTSNKAFRESLRRTSDQVRASYPTRVAQVQVVKADPQEDYRFVDEDSDNDGVSDWEDYCPRTPRDPETGRAYSVWRPEHVGPGKKGNITWVGCAGRNIDVAKKGYKPPSREKVMSLIKEKKLAFEKQENEKLLQKQEAIARAEAERQRLELRRKSPSIPGGLPIFTQNILESYASMAKATPHSLSPVFSAIVERIEMQKDLTTVTGVLDILRGHKLITEFTLPMVTKITSKAFYKTSAKLTELNALLKESLGNSCEFLQLHYSEWSITTQLELFQAAWLGLSEIGFDQKDLEKVAHLHSKLGEAIVRVESENFKKLLREFLLSQREMKALVLSFSDYSLAAGLPELMSALEKNLIGFLKSSAKIEKTQPLPIQAVEVSISEALVEASVLPIDGP